MNGDDGVKMGVEPVDPEKTELTPEVVLAKPQQQASGGLPDWVLELLKPESNDVYSIGGYLIDLSDPDKVVAGKGGQGIVLHATHRVLKDRVVIKIPLSNSASRIRAMLTEAQRQRTLKDSPGIVVVYDANYCSSANTNPDTAPKQRIFVALEYMPGGDLSQMLSRGSLEPVAAARFMVQIAEAVVDAHECRPPLIHRDLKPQNVLFNASGRPKVTDFGLAMSVDEWDGSRGGFTPRYAAPEQHQRQRVDERTDVWGLGGIFYEMLTGHPPFQGSGKDLKQAICHRMHTPVQQKNAKVPSELAFLCEKCLSKKPEARWQSARELTNALRDWEKRWDPVTPESLPRIVFLNECPEDDAAWHALAGDECDDPDDDESNGSPYHLAFPQVEERIPLKQLRWQGQLLTSSHPTFHLLPAMFVGQQVVAFCLITGSDEGRWLFGSYLWMDDAYRHEGRAIQFVRRVLDECSQLVPQLRGVVFEVDPVGEVPSADLIRIDESSPDDFVRESIRRLLRIKLYQTQMNCRVLLQANGTPISYRQPSMLSSLSPEGEVPLFLFLRYACPIPVDVQLQRQDMSEVLGYLFDVFWPAQSYVGTNLATPEWLERVREIGDQSQREAAEGSLGLIEFDQNCRQLLKAARGDSRFRL
jgi:serine/threonine protein kinase